MNAMHLEFEASVSLFLESTFNCLRIWYSEFENLLRSSKEYALW
jgi:hypothetical protein